MPMFTRLIPILLGFLLAASGQSTPGFDASGNALLNGSYFFRQVVYAGFDNSGSITKFVALSGTITFDGKGGYSVTGQMRDSTAAAAQSYTTTGGYAVAPSGLAVMDHPLYDKESVYGLVSRGVFLGSSSEGNVNDIFVAIAAGSTAASASALQGTYWVASLDFGSGAPAQTRDALFRLTANGQGNVAATSATGYVGTASQSITQPVAAFAYTLANGTGTLSFPALPASNGLVGGAKQVYVTADGAFFLAGTAGGFDLMFGTRAPAATATDAQYQGTYYTAGVNQDNSDLAASGSYLDTFWGAQSAGGNKIIRHDRVAPFNSGPYDYTFDSGYSIQADGSYDRPTFRYAIGDNGLSAVGIGKAPTSGIFLGIKAPDFSANGVYIYPTGVVNAASSAPFTAGVARGELVTIYGAGLSSATAVASLPFPNSLGGVQVTVNGRPAPIYAVSPTQLSVVVPYATELNYARFQVTNNGTQSNTVTEFVNKTAPGIFSLPPGGLGAAAALHADYSVISASKPAAVGETIQIFLTGLGDVSPAVPEGTAAPSNPLSKVSNDVAVYVDGIKATVAYAGLAPGLAGLYQINAVVPTGVSSGDVYLEVDCVDAATAQVRLRIK